MRSLFLFFLNLFFTVVIFAQPIEVDIFQKTATATTSQVGIRIRATGANVTYIGVSLYLAYQSGYAAPQSTSQNTVVGVDDSKLVTTFSWGTSARATNPQQIVNIDPGTPGGQIYDRRYIYNNIDETGGSNIQTATSQWDTLLYITFNTLQPNYPQGGYVYFQSTSENGGTLSDENFANINFIVNSGDRALGLTTLPVVFSSFSGVCNRHSNNLYWTTSAEFNSDHFNIEKSINGIDWRVIGSILASNNTSQLSNYQFTDQEGGVAYYRIREIDINGSFMLTNIKFLNCESKDISLSLYPNPADKQLIVDIELNQEITTSLKIIDGMGRIVFNKPNQVLKKGITNINMDISYLPVGFYYLVINDNGLKLNERFVIVR